MYKFSFLIILLSISLNSLASNKQSGDLIKAVDFNSSVFNIGSIQHALLNETEFQQLNGDCWVLINGQSIAGSDYANLTGRATLPSAAGRFLRNSGGSAAALGVTQEDDFKSHTHIQNAHNHIQGFAGVNSTASYGVTTAPSGNINSQSGTSLNNHPYTSSTTATNQNTGGLETRPQNLTVNMFIKINKQCNFN